MSSKTTNLNLTKPSEDEFYDINVQNENMDIIDREINGLKQPAYEVSTAMSDLNSGEMITVAFGKIAKAVSTLISHVANKSNPHGVTKNQIGLGNVPNVATNDQTPTYTEASSLSSLVSGEKTSVAFGKIAKAVSTLISHVANKSNPHGVTKNQIGLGNVPNVATNDQTPTYTEASSLSSLVSGEKTSVAFGKIAKAVSTLISHTTSKATNSVLGHVKLSDSTSSTSASTAGVAATPKAVKAAYDLANSNTKKIGTTDISGIGDGTVTGAIAENKDAIEDVTQRIQAVSKKQNFCKGSDRLLTDVLIIDFKNPTGESNSYGVIATEDASKLLNSPVTDGAFYAYREVLTIKSASKDYKVIVRLTEAYPSPGRIWLKMYNPDTSNWSGWKVI